MLGPGLCWKGVVCVWGGEGGGGGAWDLKVCGPEMAQRNLSFSKLHFFPLKEFGEGPQMVKLKCPHRLWPRLTHSHRLLPIMPMYGASTVQFVIAPASANCTGALGSTELCAHLGEGSLPPLQLATVAGPIQPHRVGLGRGLGLKTPGSVEVSYIQHSTFRG